MKKENINTILIVIMLVAFLSIAMYGLWLEYRYNNCAIDLNNCTDSCVNIDVQGGLFEQDTLLDGGILDVEEARKNNT